MLYPVIQDISEGEEGDRITIYVGARNESTDSALADNIEFRVDGNPYSEYPDNIPATYDPIPAGESRFVGTLDWYTQEGDAGTHDITLRTTNQGNEVTEQYTLGDATTFDVEIEDVRGIELGFEGGQNIVEVDWLVENNTGSGGSTDITLNVDSTQEDIESSVQFADSQERTGTLTWDAEGASIGEHDIEVTTTDDSVGQTFVVEEEDITEFDVVITGTEEVPAGTDSEIEYTVTNRSGEGSASRDVWLVVNGVEMDRHEDVSLDFDEQATDTLIWPTTNNDVGDTEVTVNTGFSGVDENIEGQDTETVTVLEADPDPQYVTDGYITMSPRDVQGSTTWDTEGSWNEYDERQNVVVTGGTARLAAPPAPPFFRVSTLNATAVDAGEEMEVQYIVRNTGDETAMTDVWLEIEGEEVDRDEDVELGENETADGSLTWQTDIDDEGEFDGVVSTEDSSLGITLQVGTYEAPSTGSKFYTVGYASDTHDVNEYAVSTPFDITTASHSSTFDVAGESNTPVGITWNRDGSNMYVAGTNNNRIDSYDVPTPFNLTTASSVSSSELDVVAFESELSGVSFNSDGSKLYIVGSANDEVREFELSTDFDITSAEDLPAVYDVSGQVDGLSGMAWNIDGSNMYVVGSGNNEINEYSLSTAFDITTASHSASYDVSGELNATEDVAWNIDGSKLYVIGSSTSEIHEYAVSTAFDITTASHSSSYDVSGEGVTVAGMSWLGIPQYQTDVDDPGDGQDGIPDGLVDNFEPADGDPEGVYESGDTISTFYGGFAGRYARTTGSAKTGTYGLARSGDSNNVFDNLVSSPGDGLNHYIEVGEPWRCWVRVPALDSSETDTIGVIFGHSSNTDLADGYIFQARASGDGSSSELEFQRRDSGSGVTVETASVDWPVGEWFELEGVHNSDGSFTGRAYDNQGNQIGSTLSASDATYITSGSYDHRGVGYLAARIGEGGEWVELRVI